MKLIDIAGLRFGRLLVLQKSKSPRMWACVCDCGAPHEATGPNLRSGGTKSCGCLAKEWSVLLGSSTEILEKRKEALVKHGNKRRGAATVEYKTWLGMKRRCYNVKSKEFANWGGRGIRVCERWVSSFENFLSDMGPRPEGQYSIDRLDPNKDYSPENCRWATAAQQGGENKRDLVPVTVNGERFKTIKTACEHFGVGVSTALQRIYAGIDPAEAVSNTSRLKPRRTRESYLPISKRGAPK